MFRSSIEISREICQVEDSGESIVKKRVRNASTNVPGSLDQVGSACCLDRSNVVDTLGKQREGRQMAYVSWKHANSARRSELKAIAPVRSAALRFPNREDRTRQDR